MKKQKLIFGGITLAGFVVALIGLFVPYVKVVIKGTVSGKTITESQRYSLFSEDLLDGEGAAWLTISKIALIVLVVALAVAGIALLVSALSKKSPKWLDTVGMIAGFVAIVATIAVLGAMIGFGSANRRVQGDASMKLWGAIGFWLAFVGGVCASTCAVLPYFKKK